MRESAASFAKTNAVAQVRPLASWISTGWVTIAAGMVVGKGNCLRYSAENTEGTVSLARSDRRFTEFCGQRRT